MLDMPFLECHEEIRELIEKYELQVYSASQERTEERKRRAKAEEHEKKVAQLQGQIAKKKEKLKDILNGTYVPPPPLKVVEMPKPVPPPEPTAEEIGRAD